MTSPTDDLADREAYAALRRSVVGRPLTRDVVRVHGPDATSFLQGQLSQDVEGLAEGASSDSLLLSPQGRIEATLRIARLAGEVYLLDTEPGFGDAVVERLVRFRLRTKVELEPDRWGGDGLRGPGAPGRAVAAAGARVCLDASWPGLPGTDLLVPTPPTDRLTLVGGDVPLCPPEPWEAARIESGHPLLGRDLDERSLAAEVGLVDRTVSFTKGCFTGQELVARLDARGSNVARRLVGVVVPGPRRAPGQLVGAVVRSAPGGEGREAGRLTSAAWSPGLEAMVALGVLHRSVVPPAGLSVELGEADVVAEARALPLVA